MKSVHSIVIFGGTGFLGTHLSTHLLNANLAEKIYLVDIHPPRTAPYAARMQEGLKSGRIEHIVHDLRTPIPHDLIPGPTPEIFINIAALHREGEYSDAEFFETNVTEAETVCDYAAAIGCNRIVFTSTISQYGIRDEKLNEKSLSIPSTPYGISKALAEKIHQIWLAGDEKRRLITIRPGVLFGPGEAANVTRLARSVIKGYFAYVGNQKTRKAGGYIKELCHVIEFALTHEENSGDRFTLMNFSVYPTPCLEQYVDAVRQTCKIRRHPIQVPRSLLLWSSYVIAGIAGIFRIKQPITPLRVHKVYRNTHFEAERLHELGYEWKYTLEDAFEDWLKDAPEELKS